MATRETLPQDEADQGLGGHDEVTPSHITDGGDAIRAVQGRRDSEAIRSSGGDLNAPANVGTVIALVNEAKKELLEHQDHKIGLVLDKLNQLSGTTLNMHSTATRGGTTGGKSTDEKVGALHKRKAPAPKNLEDSDYQYALSLVRDMDKMPFFAQWACAITINSAVAHYPALRAWIPDGTLTRLAAHSGLLRNVSGLSILFFSVQDSNWERYHSRVGKTWTFLLAQVISSSIGKVRRDIFGSEGETPQPPWLQSFGGVLLAAKYVGDMLTYFNTTKKMAKEKKAVVEAEGNTDSDRPAKRQRKELPDKYKLEKDYLINELYSNMRRLLSYARTDARKHVLSGFMFLVDEVKKCESLEVAKEKGYEVEFRSAACEMEEIVPAQVQEGSIWDVKNTATHAEYPDATVEELHAMNSALLAKVAKDFPSLSLILHYKRQIIVPEGGSDGSDIPKYWNEQEEVSLLEIALKILTSMSLAAKDTKLLLRSSKLTVKAVLLLAHGLRGLVKQSLSKDPEGLEQVTLGVISARSLEKEEDDDIEIVSTALVGRTSKSDAKRKKKSSKTSIVESIRNEKFLIQYDEYLRKLALRNALRVADDATSRSEGGGSPLQPPDDHPDTDVMDLDESYLG